ncbi:glutamate-5-semialdehyde dehydrogenase [Psychrosphaera haliotis]|uniref:glutamate-5-semialdehyde dehydrogenase n=1 Tax=Psychrosphaera haliotis TaxID=555083 RepID=UPI0031D5637B
MSYIKTISQAAKSASKKLAILSEQEKNAVLLAMAKNIKEAQPAILEANKIDLKNAADMELEASFVDRLTLNSERIDDMVTGIKEIVALDDPIGSRKAVTTRPNGLEIEKMRIPLGVICMIYESRPNVTADAGALCFKSGNGVVLRGGKEALNSSLAIAAAMHKALEEHNLPKELVAVIDDPARELVLELISQVDSIDLVIPRGGEGLIKFVSDNSKIPVIQHFKGVCHLYVDKDADFEKALRILENGKTQRTGVCNALEGLLVHADIAEDFLPIAAKMLQEKGVKVNACQRSHGFFLSPILLPYSDFGQEYLSLEIAIRTVDSFEQALDHIDEFGSHHTEVICTENEKTAQMFQLAVDASVVMVNASSRFSDGSQLGLGAEIGIATTKLHAYGPMGLESLTAEKFVVTGEGQVR